MSNPIPQLQPILSGEQAFRAVLFPIAGIEEESPKTPEQWLTETELTEYRALNSEKTRRERLASRIALKSLLLRDGIIRRAQDVSVRKDERGAPHLVIYEPDTLRYAEMACSISHSGPYVLVAYSPQRRMRIGVDIEHRTWRLMMLRRKFISPNDRMLEKDDSLGDAAVLWTFKEALSKVLGEGFGCGFRTLSCVETSPGNCDLTDADGKSYIGRYCWFGRFAVSVVYDMPDTLEPTGKGPFRHPFFARIRRGWQLRRLRRLHQASAASAHTAAPAAPENKAPSSSEDA